MKQLIACAVAMKIGVVLAFFLVGRTLLSLQIEPITAFWATSVFVFMVCLFGSSLAFYDAPAIVTAFLVASVAICCFILVALIHNTVFQSATLLSGGIIILMIALVFIEAEAPYLKRLPTMACLGSEAVIIFISIALLAHKLFGVSILR